VPTLPRDEQIQDSCAAAYKIRPQLRAIQGTSQPTHTRGLGCSKEEGVKFKSTRLFNLPFEPLGLCAGTTKTTQCTIQHGQIYTLVTTANVEACVEKPSGVHDLGPSYHERSWTVSPPSDLVSSLPCPAHRPARPDSADWDLQPFSPRDKASRYIAIAWSCKCRT
jgi:hypothetical protein